MFGKPLKSDRYHERLKIQTEVQGTAYTEQIRWYLT